MTGPALHECHSSAWCSGGMSPWLTLANVSLQLFWKSLLLPAFPKLLLCKT